MSVVTQGRSWDAEWAKQAACAQTSGDPDGLFVRGREQRVARAICAHCPVQAMCLADALDGRIEYGVWGGMTERERRALLARRPDVTSWADEIKKLMGSPTSAPRPQLSVVR